MPPKDPDSRTVASATTEAVTNMPVIQFGPFSQALKKLRTGELAPRTLVLSPPNPLPVQGSIVTNRGLLNTANAAAASFCEFWTRTPVSEQGQQQTDPEQHISFRQTVNGRKLYFHIVSTIGPDGNWERAYSGLIEQDGSKPIPFRLNLGDDGAIIPVGNQTDTDFMEFIDNQVPIILADLRGSLGIAQVEGGDSYPALFTEQPDTVRTVLKNIADSTRLMKDASPKTQSTETDLEPSAAVPLLAAEVVSEQPQESTNIVTVLAMNNRKYNLPTPGELAKLEPGQAIAIVSSDAPELHLGNDSIGFTLVLANGSVLQAKDIKRTTVYTGKVTGTP